MTSVTNGTRLGPYEIVSRIGAGGMGEVWRAKDTRLDRSVAIKILPAQLAQNAQLKVRFEREARAISQLTHPHICTLYDVGDDYLVMELLDGESLAERLQRGPLPMSDVLRYGAEVADALDRAHRAGIIHRDLKPANIMITKSGAKLLDFGLAKATAMELGGDAPTMQKDITQEGTLLGTFQYMAPEQLDGLAADARTDLFALGAVLYEMATGRRAFEGKTRTSIIAAIVSGQPQPISALQPVTPPALEHVVQKCLEKEPDARWQSAHDVAEELRWIATAVQPATAVASRRINPALAIATALLALIAIAAMAMVWRNRTRPREHVAFAIPVPPKHSLNDASISPDGRSVAMHLYDERNESSLWIRRLDEIEPKKLHALKTSVSMMFWSPDSARIFYCEQGELKRIAVSGGQPETIVKGLGGCPGATWSSQGTIVYSSHWNEGLFRVSADGGEPVRITTLDAKRRETGHVWPQFLPDGEHFLYISHTLGDEPNQIYAGSLDGKTRKHITRADALVGFARSSLVYVRDNTMYAVPFDDKNLELEGVPVRIADGVLFLENAASSVASLSRDGAFLYLPIDLQMRSNEVGWYDRSGRLIEKLFSDKTIFDIRFSHDGTRAVMSKLEPKKGAPDVYTLDMARRIPTRITGGLSSNSAIGYSADGTEVYFNSDRDGMFDLYAQSEDGTTPARVVWKSDRDKGTFTVLPDGSALVANRYDAKTQNDLWVVPLRGGAPHPLIATDANEYGASISPDGRWLTYVSDRSGREEVYVRRFPNGRSIQVSTDGGDASRWKFDSSEMFPSFAGRFYAVPMRSNGDTPAPGPPVLLFELSPETKFVRPSPTSDRFLMCVESNRADNPDRLHYVSGWN